MRRILIIFTAVVLAGMSHAKTLVVYYSFTNHVHEIVMDLTGQIDADIVRIEPSEKGLDYAADNYALGSALISAILNNPDDASSYPEIDPVDVDLSEYDCIMIGAPLWWSHIAAPLQTYLFQNGSSMAGKKIGLIVSSSSSGISGVEADARRLIPAGHFISPSLWIRSSQLPGAHEMISEWLQTINYDLITGIDNDATERNLDNCTVYSIDGRIIGRNVLSFQNFERGLYIVNGEIIYLNN